MKIVKLEIQGLSVVFEVVGQKPAYGSIDATLKALSVEGEVKKRINKSEIYDE